MSNGVLILSVAQMWLTPFEFNFTTTVIVIDNIFPYGGIGTQKKGIGKNALEIKCQGGKVRSTSSIHKLHLYNWIAWHDERELVYQSKKKIFICGFFSEPLSTHLGWAVCTLHIRRGVLGNSRFIGNIKHGWDSARAIVHRRRLEEKLCLFA